MTVDSLENNQKNIPLCHTTIGYHRNCFKKRFSYKSLEIKPIILITSTAMIIFRLLIAQLTVLSSIRLIITTICRISALRLNSAVITAVLILINVLWLILISWCTMSEEEIIKISLTSKWCLTMACCCRNSDDVVESLEEVDLGAYCDFPYKDHCHIFHV